MATEIFAETMEELPQTTKLKPIQLNVETVIFAET
jgi:hypothetical protein